MTRNPTVAETVAVHAKLIARFGGSEGIRDRAALESALARARSGYYSDLIQEAAALWESLSRNHANDLVDSVSYSRPQLTTRTRH